MFDRFLDWFERHKFGVVGTLMLHTFMLFAMAISKLPIENEAKAEQEMVMELAAPEDLPPDPMLQPPLSAPVEVKNLTSNVTGQVQPQMRMYPGQQAQEQMASDVEEELLAFEAEEFRKRDSARKAQGKEVVMPELDPSKWDPKQYMPKDNVPVKVEGNTTVELFLDGRGYKLNIPAYLCKGHGRVRISISVDRSGKLRHAEIDPAGTNTTDACLLDNALLSAQGAHFTPSSTAPDPQSGNILFTFLAQ